jgi:hypothetical protein
MMDLSPEEYQLLLSIVGKRLDDMSAKIALFDGNVNGLEFERMCHAQERVHGLFHKVRDCYIAIDRTLDRN